MAYLWHQHWGRSQCVGNGMDKTYIVKAIKRLLTYHVSPKKRLREKQERQVVTFAKRGLREPQDRDTKPQVVPPGKGSESRHVVTDADHYLGRGDQYDMG